MNLPELRRIAQDLGSMHDLDARIIRIYEAGRAEVVAENDKLRRLLAESTGACPYCSLPAARMGECAHGFPGCSRADDMMLDGGPTMTAWVAAEVAAERARIVAWLRSMSAERGALVERRLASGDEPSDLELILEQEAVIADLADEIEAGEGKPSGTNNLFSLAGVLDQ